MQIFSGNKLTALDTSEAFTCEIKHKTLQNFFFVLRHVTTAVLEYCGEREIASLVGSMFMLTVDAKVLVRHAGQAAYPSDGKNSERFFQKLLVNFFRARGWTGEPSEGAVDDT